MKDPVSAGVAGLVVAAAALVAWRRGELPRHGRRRFVAIVCVAALVSAVMAVNANAADTPAELKADRVIGHQISGLVWASFPDASSFRVACHWRGVGRFRCTIAVYAPGSTCVSHDNARLVRWHRPRTFEDWSGWATWKRRVVRSGHVVRRGQSLKFGQVPDGWTC